MAEASAQTTTRPALEAQAYCPHCFLLVETGVEGAWPAQPTRCQHCRLMIGPGRARPTSEANPGARGTAAGVFAHRAKQTAGDDGEACPDDVRAAIRTVAQELGSRPERLLMVDYQQRAVTDDALPDLDDVFAAFGSWKQARRAAANGNGNGNGARNSNGARNGKASNGNGRNGSRAARNGKAH